MTDTKENENINEPFSDDLLFRKPLAINLKNVLLNSDLNVISISAPWGGGKTYFIENLIKTMQDESINILYNAWESDFYDSPLIPLLVELLDKIEQSDQKTELEQEIKSVKDIVKKIFDKTSFQAEFNVGIVNCSANFDPNKKIIESEYIELKNQIQDFKNKLKSIQERLNKKIIIFIDELDRCNPMYTIKTLEIIKHFFGMKNILFVLAVDKSQIENSVRTVFGVNIGQENGYLRKFIDAEFLLPATNTKEIVNYHLEKLWNKIEKFKDTGRFYFYPSINENCNEKSEICEMIFIILNLLKFNARETERYFTRLGLLFDALSKDDILFIEPCAVLNALAMYSKEEFDNYVLCKQSEISNNLNNKFFKHWKGLFISNYNDTIKRTYHMDSIPNETVESNVVNMRRKHITDYIFNKFQNEQYYFMHYPMKIEFINNFSTH